MFTMVRNKIAIKRAVDSRIGPECVLIAVSARFCRSQPFQDCKSACRIQIIEHEKRQQIRMPSVVGIVLHAKDSDGIAAFPEE